ncbi:MAG: malonyl-ACP O-methyltransferase BioC [Acidiferrobacterales bacterium]
MNEIIHYPLELVRKHFDQAARQYDAHALVQREIADRLLEHLEGLKLDPQTIVDVGCGTGYCTRALQKTYPRAQVTGIDLAPAMVAQAKRQRRWFGRNPDFQVGDAHTLELADNSVDLLLSSLTIQWCDTDKVLQEFARVLKPGGLLLLSSFGPDTLMELRQAWQAVDAREHVHTFIDMHDLGDAMVRNGFTSPVLDVDRLVMNYDSVLEILHDLKGIGAQNLAPERPRGLTGKRLFKAFCTELESHASEGVLPLTYEAVFAHAWAGQQGRTEGEAIVPFPARRARQ